jgi:hypothetical protein
MSGSSNEVLRDVLGLPSSSPTWVEDTLRQIVRDLSNREVDAALIEDLQGRLAVHGLERYVPSTLAGLVKGQLTK